MERASDGSLKLFVTSSFLFPFHLQVAMGNTEHYNSQRQAALSLELFVTSFPFLFHQQVAMGNEEHSDSQRQAAFSLKLFVTSFPFVDDEVRTAMGDELYNAFAADPERLPVNLTPVQADIKWISWP